MAPKPTARGTATRGRGRGRGGTTSTSKKKGDKPIPDWYSSTLAKWDGYAMEAEDNKAFYAEKARLEAEADLTYERYVELRALHTEHGPQMSAAGFQMNLDTIKEFNNLHKKTFELAVKEGQRVVEVTEELEEVLRKYQEWSEQDDDLLPVRLAVIETSNKVRETLARVLKGEFGTFISQDTPESLKKELQKRNELQEKQAEILTSTIGEMQKLLASAPEDSVRVKDYTSVVEWQKQVVDRLNALEIEHAALQSTKQSLATENDRLRSEVERLNKEVDRERGEKEKARTELQAERQAKDNLLESERQARAKLQDEFNSLRDNQLTLSSSKAITSAELQSLRETTSAEIKTLREISNAELKTLRSTTDAELETLRQKISDLTTQRDQSVDKANTLMSENAKKDVDLRELEVLRKAKSEVDKRNEDLHKNHDADRSHIQNLIQQVGAIKLELAAANSAKSLADAKRESAELRQSQAEKERIEADHKIRQLQEDLEGKIIELQIAHEEGAQHADTSAVLLQKLDNEADAHQSTTGQLDAAVEFMHWDLERQEREARGEPDLEKDVEDIQDPELKEMLRKAMED
ncbi:hypothetical protein CC80DRAFT_493699 [Byssothecium circinans]|uniref:Uncharacterized protein n=1 Tax=Byssothecium circinans TaxID=147558 RepID=A0A6A5TRH3_9PLEO|nr:hypothetical protein CC80DRAFT_493699 [Byssothecium circinans]